MAAAAQRSHSSSVTSSLPMLTSLTSRQAMRFCKTLLFLDGDAIEDRAAAIEERYLISRLGQNRLAVGEGADRPFPVGAHDLRPTPDRSLLL